MSVSDEVNVLKESLEKEVKELSKKEDGDENNKSEEDEAADDEGGERQQRCMDLLKKLQDVDMSLAVLTNTLIGATVSKFKSHEGEIGETAKGLIKKWKKVAKGGSDNGAGEKKRKSFTTTTSDETSKKSKVERRESGSGSSDPINVELEWQGLPTHRQNICKKMYELLLLAKPDMIKAGINGDAINHLTGPRAAELEGAINDAFKDKKAYADKARSIAFNLKKNRPLCQQVILGEIEPKELAQMSSEQLANQDQLKARAQAAKKAADSKRMDWDQANEEKINKMCGIKGDLLAASLFTCGRCKSVKTTSTQKQTRSADEPMTVFVLCLNCGKRWKC